MEIISKVRNSKKFIYSLSVIILIILCIWLLWDTNSEKNNLKNSPIQELSLQTYYSKSSRDEEKYLQTKFKLGDPIQLNLDYKNVFEKIAVTLDVENGKGKSIQNNTFDIEGTKSIFVTLGSITEKGNYKAYISYEGQKIASANFSVAE
ncbi:hypothetical protein KBD45_00075 [Candidatus Dojkabacteria bacterium]|nr:hypothetical protein [Candidatus Dojkabacteria bacterium]